MMTIMLCVMIRFEVLVKFSIPSIALDPEMSEIQTALSAVARDIIKVPQGKYYIILTNDIIPKDDTHMINTTK